MPIVGEHEQVITKLQGKSDELATPTAKMVNELLNRSKRASESIRAEYGSNYRFFHGSQWSFTRPMYRFSEVLNVTWAAIMQEVGIQTDSRPRTEYVATEPSDFEFANILKDVNEINWNKYDWLQTVQNAVTECKIFPVSHSEVFWNPELENGLGDIDFKILNPFYCYWDPKAEDVDTLRYFIYIEPTPTSELQKKYPDADVKPDIESFATTGGHDYRISVDQDKVRLGLGTQSFRTRPISITDEWGGEPMTLLVRCWIKDQEITEEVIKNEQEGTEETVQKLKYPKGRYIEMANNTILKDGENGVYLPDGSVVPYEHGRIPIARLVNYSYPREYVGCDEITHVRAPQRVINYTWSYILDVMKKGSSPQKIVSFNSGIEDLDKITDEPGLVIEANDVNSIRYEQGPGVPASMFNVLDNAITMFNRVQGLEDSARGAQQPNVTSGLMLEGVVEAAQTRPRLKNRSLDQYLRQVGELMLYLYLQFYKQPRVFRMTNKEGYPEFFEFFITEDEGGNKAANVRELGVGGDGQVRPGQTQQALIKGVPDVKVVAGSSLPFSKALKAQTAKELFAQQAIDQEELLKALDWPNWQEVLKRVQEQQAQAAQQAAAEGAQGAV